MVDTLHLNYSNINFNSLFGNENIEHCIEDIAISSLINQDNILQVSVANE